MNRISAFLLFVALSFAVLPPAHAQIFKGPDSARLAQKAAKKEQKANEKRARKQLKAQMKYAKMQKKAAKHRR